MAILLIDKIKQKSGDFKLVDAADVDFNGKGLDEAFADGTFKGDKGDKGAAGAQGPKGDTGAAGARGEVGPTGAKGADGATWLSGSAAPTTQGKDGDYYINTATWDVYKKASGAWTKDGNIKGATGAPGAAGPKGDTGTQGATGPKGATGETGPTGPQGEKGDPFAIAKTYASITAMNAAYATDGLKNGQFVLIDTGNVEDKDNAKLYVKGSAAYNYVTDLSGATGMTGPQGPTGAKGAAGATGPAGPQGEKGDTGARGATGAAGAAGAAGPQGEKGATGAKGADGTSPTFEVRDGHLIAIYAE